MSETTRPSGIMKDVHIQPVLNGFIVSVGCQTLVFNTIEAVAKNLVEYQKNPNAVEKSFIENAVNTTSVHPTHVTECLDSSPGRVVRATRRHNSEDHPEEAVLNSEDHPEEAVRTT